MPTKSEVEKVQAETTPQALLEHLGRCLPEFTATAAPQRMRVGHPGSVYRVPGEPEPLMVKVAVPQTAAAPLGTLDPHRLAVEARSLAAFELGGALKRATTATVRPPHLIHFDPTRHILVMEDVADLSHLGQWLAGGGAEEEIPHPRRPGKLLGTFVAALHWESFADPKLAIDFDNSAMQGSWLSLHYSAVSDVLREAGLADADELGRKASELSEQFQTPGICVIHGNLWPPSIRIAADGLRVIDWELTHYGHPAQDVGHLSSHLWMHAHRASTPEAADRARATRRDFLTTYRLGLGSAFDEVFGAHAVRQSTIHFGVEILMQTLGVLRDRYLYQGLTADAPAVQEAVDVAAQHIRSPDDVDTFAPLLT